MPQCKGCHFWESWEWNHDVNREVQQEITDKTPDEARCTKHAPRQMQHTHIEQNVDLAGLPAGKVVMHSSATEWPRTRWNESCGDYEDRSKYEADKV